MRERDYGLDLTRAAAAVLVLAVHFFMNSGFYDEPLQGAGMALESVLRMACMTCVPLFMVLTGYLCIGKKWKKGYYRGLIPVLLTYLLTAAVCLAFRVAWQQEQLTLLGAVRAVFDFSAAPYGWYVEMYVGLTLLTPFINLSLKQLSTKGLLGFSAVLLFLSALPGLTPWVVVPSFWKFLYPVSFYVLGAIFRRVQPKINPLLGFAAAFTSAFLMGAVTVLSTDGTFSDAMTWSFGDLGMVIVSVGLFVGMYRLKFPNGLGKFLAFAATGSYGAYLLSHLLDAQFYKFVMPWRREGRFLLIFLCVTVPIYIASMGMGIGLDRVTGLLLKLGEKMIRPVKNALRKKLPQG